MPRFRILTIAVALFAAASIPVSATEICRPVHHHKHVTHIHHVKRTHSARLAPCKYNVINVPERTEPGYDHSDPLPEAYKDITGKNGSPCYRAADQQRSYALHCGIVYHRFFDEHGASVDRGVRVCN